MNTFEKNKSDLESYGYKLVTWDEFVNATDRPDGLLERAQTYVENETLDYVVYDPEDDEDGFLLVSPYMNELASDTCEYISNMLPEEGPLAV